jgi:signal transduction histidine kinase/AmiR/NasT family two-component response regulator
METASPAPRPEIVARAAWLEGEALFRLGDLDEAADALSAHLALGVDAPEEITGKLLLTQGRVARARGDNGQALKSFQEAFAVFTRVENRRYMAIALQGLSTLYTNARQYERAIEYDRRAAELFPDDPMIELSSLNNRAVAFTRLKRYGKARSLLEQALETDVVAGSPPFANRIEANLASVELDASRYDAASRALARIEERIASDASLERPILAAAIAAELRREAGDPSGAAELLDEAFEGMDLAATTEDDFDAHRYAFAVYRAAGRADAALSHLEALKRLGDDQRDIAASANLAILTAEFELSAKELEIATLRGERLQAEVALLDAKRRQEQLIAAAIVLFALGVTGLFISRGVHAHRTRRITEALNEKLRKSNAELAHANLVKTEFLATTSHEIRTPLNAVINLTSAAIDEIGETGPSRAKLSTALRSAQHLHAIVSDVLDVARLEGKRVEPHVGAVHLASVVEDVAQLWRPKAEDKGLAFEVQADLPMEHFLTDERLLRQVLSNLLSNAIKFTEEGSILLRISGGTPLKPLQIEVSDTGLGISPENQEEIFESFRQIDAGSTRSFGGTGLGLAICRQITDLLGGSIDVSSAIGAGTTFKVILPASSVPSADKPAVTPLPKPLPPEELGASLAELRVLAAEDNAVNAMVIQTILQTRVRALTIVENGREAVEAVETGDFDIVLMDKQMPVMDGVMATREIRALGGKAADVPIIAVTADAFAQARDEILGAGANDYLAKPIKPDELMQAIVANVARAKQNAAEAEANRVS